MRSEPTLPSALGARALKFFNHQSSGEPWPAPGLHSLPRRAASTPRRRLDSSRCSLAGGRSAGLPTMAICIAVVPSCFDAQLWPNQNALAQSVAATPGTRQPPLHPAIRQPAACWEQSTTQQYSTLQQYKTTSTPDARRPSSASVARLQTRRCYLGPPC